MRLRGAGYTLSQRARKQIEDLFGESADWRGLRPVRRRDLTSVREETLLIAWELNLKRLAEAPEIRQQAA
jgi:hypothetical protein